MDKKIFLAVGLCSLLLLSSTEDDKKEGFNLKSFEKSLCCIPKGRLVFIDSAEISGYKIEKRLVRIDSFYMCNHVVSNKEYRLFLDDLKSTDLQLYAKMYPDTLVWTRKTGFMEDMVKYYFIHPAYGNYPVVGVSHEQAEFYCKWLTEKYMKESKRKFKKVVFKLPSIYQWERAAFGGGDGPFPWGAPYLKNNLKKYRGQSMANYFHTPEQSIKRVNDTGKLMLTSVGWMIGFQDNMGNDAADITSPVLSYWPNLPSVITVSIFDITSPVLSYWPNGYGLYNMAGNVEEYVAEVGITKGGGWSDPAYYLQIWTQSHYNNAQSVSDKIGFRVAMEEVL